MAQIWREENYQHWTDYLQGPVAYTSAERAPEMLYARHFSFLTLAGDAATRSQLQPLVTLEEAIYWELYKMFSEN